MHLAPGPVLSHVCVPVNLQAKPGFSNMLTVGLVSHIHRDYTPTGGRRLLEMMMMMMTIGRPASRTCPDSANGRASASGAGGRGFDPGPRHTKGLKNGTSGYLAWRSAL